MKKWNEKIRIFIQREAFSLVELSVVLTIIGITIAGALDLATNKTESDRIAETNARLDSIEEALELFLVNNSRLPCPADASLVLTTANAGKEGTPTAASCASSNFNDGSYTYSGTVPVKTLGLPEKVMADDWGRRFTYVVDKRFANNATTSGGCSSTDGSQMCFRDTTISASNTTDKTSITVNETVANSSTLRADDAVYAIVSHGKNGYGAWKYVGSATRLLASSDTDEKDNAGNDKGSFDKVFVQSDTTTVFDDITRYQTKDLLIDSVGGITDSATCLAAEDAVNLNADPTSTDPCPNTDAGAQAKCYILAAAVYNLCLQP